MTRWSRSLAPTSAWVLAAVAPALVFIVTALNREYQYDFWHHLARGRAIVETGSVVNTDLFTYTVPGRSFQDVNWLSQVIFYLLYRTGGLDLVQFANSFVLAVTMALVVDVCRRASRSLRLACALGVFAFFGLWQMLTIRPQTFSLFLFVLLYEVLDRAELLVLPPSAQADGLEAHPARAERRSWLLVLPPFVMMLWVNLHGAFPIGFALIGGFLLARAVEAARVHRWWVWRDRQTVGLALCLAASLAAILVNPYGWKVYQYVGATSGTASAREIMEWMPPGLKLFIGKMWAASVLLLLAAFSLRGRRPTVRELVLIFLFFPLACGAVRMVGWWLLVCVPILAAHFAAVLPRAWLEGDEDRAPSVPAGVAFGVLMLLVIASVPGLGRYVPVAALSERPHRTEASLERVAEYLRTIPGEKRVFSTYEWGEYLGWSLAPEGKVFMDCRIEIFPDDVWADYLAVSRGRADWQEVLAPYDVNCLVLNAWHTWHWFDLKPQVEKSGDWELVLRSGDALVFRRRGAALGATAMRQPAGDAVAR